jgi:hypothetical protein
MITVPQRILQIMSLGSSSQGSTSSVAVSDSPALRHKEKIRSNKTTCLDPMIYTLPFLLHVADTRYCTRGGGSKKHRRRNGWRAHQQRWRQRGGARGARGPPSLTSSLYNYYETKKRRDKIIRRRSDEVTQKLIS